MTSSDSEDMEWISNSALSRGNSHLIAAELFIAHVTCLMDVLRSGNPFEFGVCCMLCFRLRTKNSRIHCCSLVTTPLRSSRSFTVTDCLSQITENNDPQIRSDFAIPMLLSMKTLEESLSIYSPARCRYLTATQTARK